MSIGGAGGPETADALASDALVASGVVVVSTASNDGNNAYMTGTPGNATGVIAVASVDTIAQYPGATVDRATGTDVNGINQNAFPELPVAGTLQVIVDDPGTPIDPITGEGDEHLGCHAADYGTLPANSIAVIQRGVCAFVDKGAAAQEAGAVGVIVINRDDVPLNELPAFLGYSPSLFDIPMVGVARAAKAGLTAADGTAATLAPGPGIPNDHFLGSSDFTSGGPRLGDSAQKPDVSAPGENIISTGAGLGFKANTLSGTSMASPHVAGVAALVRQRHPGFRPEQIKSLIVGTAVQAKVSPFNARLAGSGMVQPRRAVDSVAYVLGTDRTPNLSFGYDQIRIGGYRESKSFTIYNSSASPIIYKLDGGLISLPGSSSRVRVLTLSATTVTVPARSSRTITATVNLTTSPARRQQVRQPDRARRHRLGQPAQLRRRDHGHSDRSGFGPLPAARPVARRAAVRVERRRVRAIGVHRRRAARLTPRSTSATTAVMRRSRTSTPGAFATRRTCRPPRARPTTSARSVSRCSQRSS